MELSLTNGGVTLVDYEDYLYFRQWNWSKMPTGHVRRCKHGKILLLHVEILKRAFGYTGQPDHKDRNPLNNQRTNLRPSTQSQNRMNSGLMSNSTTGYKGVDFKKDKYRYRARIGLEGKVFFLGYFVSSEEAAKAYDRAARRYHGEFACLNFPEKSCE